MNISKTKKFDDNSLFRYLSRSYSKSKPSQHPTPFTPSKTSTLYAQNTRHPQKTRSQSSSFCNVLSSSVTISQNNSLPRQGFLKYRNFSVNESLPLNSSIETPNKSILLRLGSSFKESGEKNFTDFKRTISEFDSDKILRNEFGLRNIVREVKNQFRSSVGDLDNGVDRASIKLEKYHQLPKRHSRESLQYDGLCPKSRQLFSGEKRYNLNGFILTENVKGLNKGMKNTIKTSLMNRKVKKFVHNHHNENHSRKQTNVTLC